jgi:hypothetical protein
MMDYTPVNHGTHQVHKALKDKGLEKRRLID